MRASTHPILVSLGAFLASQGLLLSPAAAQNYFDYDGTSGLTPTGNITPVDFLGNYWQDNASPGTNPPGAFQADESVYFYTGGINLLSLDGTATVFNLIQDVAGTATTISGSGTLTLVGDALQNLSTGSLVFGQDLTLALNTSQSSTREWLASAGSIIVNGVIQGAVGTLNLAGTQGIFLNGANTYTGTTNVNGLVIAGDTKAFGTSSILFNGGTLRLVAGLTQDFSSQFGSSTGNATIDTNGNNLTWNTSFVSTGTLTKTGDGRLRLANDNPLFTGKLVVAQGLLALGTGANPAGTKTSASDGIEILPGATLDISGMANSIVDERIVVSGHGVGNLGAIMKNSGGGMSLNQVTLAGHTTLNVNNRFDFDNILAATGYSVTKIGSGELPFEAPGVANLGNVYVKQGQVTFTGGGDFGVATDTIYLNSGTVLSGWNKGADTKAITLNGGHLIRNGTADGASTAVVTVNGGLRLNSGASDIRHGVSNLEWALGTINRAVGATLNHANTSTLPGPAGVNPTAAMATTTSANQNGILGGYFTYGGSTWAVNSGATVVAGKTNVVVGLAEGSYNINDFDNAANNVDVGNGNHAPAVDRTINSLRFNNGAGATTLTLSGTNTISSGGILVTSVVGNNAVVINGDTLRGSVAGDLIIHQNNTSNSLTIQSEITDNSGATALTKSGAGVLNLRGVNTYTGHTYINGAPGGGTSGILDVNSLATAGNDNLGAVTNQVFFNNGTLRYSNTTTNAELARQVNLFSGGGTFDVQDAARTLTISGKITGEALAADEGFFYGQGDLVKNGSGTLVLTSGNNDYTGQTIVNSGVLRLSGAGKLGGRTMHGEAYYSRLTVNNGGILELNGTNQQVGLLGGSAGGIIRNGAATDSVLSIGNDDATFVSSSTNWGLGNGFEGSIQDGSGGGKTSLQKTGVGYQIFSGVSTYTGTTTVAEGTLQIGAGMGATHAARSGSGLHTVQAGATLAGNGIIGGSTVVDEGGLLSIGNFGQTAAQTLAIAGGLTGNGTVSFDLWTHVGTATTNDLLRFTANGVVALNGSLIVNNMLVTPNTWAVGESIKLVDWGAVAVGNRSWSELLDISTLGLTTPASSYWDTSRFLLDGTILVMAQRDAFIWDFNTGSTGPQDGGPGTWNTANNNWWVDGDPGSNASFINGSDAFFGSNAGAAGTVTIDNTGGVTVRNLTFNPAGSGHYTIAGTGANGVLTLESNSLVTTNHVFDDNNGTTISAAIAGTNWTKAGQGRLILSGANTFTGVLSVLEGELDVRHANALGTTAGNTIVGPGATLSVRGGLTVAEGLNLSGSGLNNRGALRNHADSNTFSGAIVLGADAQITSRSGQLSLTGLISGAQALTITGENSDAVVRLAGADSNTYSGGTYINSGVLFLQKSVGVNAIAANTTVYVGDGSGSTLDILRLGQFHQIADNVLLNFRGQGSGAGVFQLNAFNETIGAIQSQNGDGIIENGSTSAVSTLTLNPSGNFVYSGVIRNGTGVLNLVKTNSGVQTLTGNNTYTGSTLVQQGVLELAGANGRLNGTSSIRVVNGATLRLLNSLLGGNHNDRLLNGNRVTLAGGGVDLANDGSATNFSESLGVVDLQGGANTLSATQAATGQTSALTLQALERNLRATVNFTGTGLGLNARNQILLTTPPAAEELDHGLIGAWATVGNEYAKYGGFGITALTAEDYVTADEADWLFTDNAKLTGSVTLTDDRHVNSLNVQQAAATTIGLGGNILRLESGGLLVSGAFDSVISNGSLTAGTGANAAGELIVHQNAASNTLNISAGITNNGAGAVGVTKSGAGTLVLSGSNTFTGGVTLNQGTLRLNHANAFASGNDLAVHGGTLDLNGHNITAGAFSSALNASAGSITNTAATTVTLTVGAGNASGSYYGSIAAGTGAISLVKTGAGVIELAGSNAHTGTITVQSGTLRIGHAGAFGSTLAANGTTVSSGATLLLAAEGTYNETISIAGEGVDRQGALVLANESVLRGGADQVRVMNLVLTGNATINNTTKRLDLDGTLVANGFALTKIGSSQMTIEGSPTSNLGDFYIKQGTVTFGGGNSTMGNSANTIFVNAVANFHFFNTGTQSKNVTLRGGTWTREGSTNTNVFTVTSGLKLEAGASAFVHSATQSVIHLNAITRDVGATFNVNNAGGGPLTTDTSNTNGIIGGYMTWGGNTWAVSADSAADTNITGLADASYTNATIGNWTSASNVTLAGNPSAAVDTRSINSLRMTAAAALTINAGQTLTLQSGGILITGAGATSISGGTLLGLADKDLIVIHNGSAALTIQSVIANSGTSSGLTKSGTGTLVLTGTNTYSGKTFINGSAGGGATGVLEVGTILASGSDNLGDNSATNDLVFNRGTLRYTGASNTSLSRDVQLLSGGGIFEVTNSSSVSLEITGVISGETLANNEGFYDGQGTLTKGGSGTLVLGGAVSNTYTGNTIVSGGVLALNKTGGAQAIIGNIILNGGTLRLDGSDQVADSSLVTLNGSTIFNLNGQAETIGGLVGTSTDTVVTSQDDAAVLEVNVAANKTHAYAGSIIQNVQFVKSGAGTQVLTGSNGYSGGTVIEEGVLQIGNGGATGELGDGGVAISSGAELAMNVSETRNVAQNLTGEGGFAQTGSGATRFASGYQHTYTGGTRVTAGMLIVNSTELAVGAGPVTVTGGVLAGSGVVSGNTVVKELGRVAIGDPDDTGHATLTINGDFGLQRSVASEAPRLVFDVFGGGIYNDANLGMGGSAYTGFASLTDYYASGTVLADYEGETGSHDRLDITGDFNLDAGARLVLNNVDHIFAAGDVFNLLDWGGLFTHVHSVDGAWNVNSDLVLPDLAGSLLWDRSLFLSHGILTVIVPEPGRALLLLAGMSALLLRRRRRALPFHEWVDTQGKIRKWG